MLYKRVLVLPFVVLTCFLSFSQGSQSSIDQTLNFAKLVEWPSYQEAFKVHVITRNSDIKLAFQSLEKTDKLKGKAIDVSTTTYAVVPKNVNLIFISKQYNAAIPAILGRIGDKPILLVTEAYGEQQNVMFNIVPSAGSFEYNPANISLQGLKLSGDPKSLGGREISLLDLYQKVRDSIRSVQLEAPSQEQMVDSLNINMAVARRLIRFQLDSIDQQKKKIEQGDRRLQIQGSRLDSLSKQVGSIQYLLDSVSSTLNKREAELAGLSDQIEKQKEDALRGQRILENQVELIAQRDREIKEREESLAEMSSVIDLQRNSLTLLVLFVVLLAVFLFFIFRAYKDRKKTARKLAVQRDELREQKEELSALLLELQQTQSQLVQSEKMASLGVLTAGIAHEINNAINFVYSGINILDTKFKEILPVMKRVGSLKEDDQNIQEKMKEIFAEKMKVEYDEAQELITQMIDYVQVGAKRTAEIVDGLRSFSRTNLEEKTESDLHKDLDVAILLLSSKLKDQIRIEKEYGENVPHVLAFQGQLGQAFLNVISNARDAAMEKGDDPCIKLATKVVDDHVSISISDNGVGMNQEDIDKIFDPFFTTKDIGVGTGLGLSITYGIIEKHGGKISVNTEKGKGSTFTIELPIRHEVEPVSEAS